MLYKKKLFILQDFLREHDLHGETMGAGVGSNFVSLPVRCTLVT